MYIAMCEFVDKIAIFTVEYKVQAATERHALTWDHRQKPGNERVIEA